MNSSTSSSKLQQASGSLGKLPAPVILLFVVLVFESVYYLATEPLTGSPWKQPTPDDGLVAAKYNLAKSDQPYDIAFVGDSSCLRGIIPAEFSQRSGLSSINLCTHKMHSMAGYALMATRVAREHPELKSIVLVVTPETLGISEENIIEYGALGKHLVAYGDEGLGLSAGLPGFQQWFVSRHALRSFPEQFGSSYARLVEMLGESGGYLPEKPSNNTVNTRYPQKFKLAPWHQQWLVRLNAEFEKTGPELLLALSPIPENGSNAAFVQSAEQTMVELVQPLNKVKVIRPRPPEYPNIAFASPGHILPEWASKNTRDLIPRVASSLEHP